MIYVNDIPLSVTIFPDNTSQVWKIPEGMITPICNIRWEFLCEAELLHLAQLKTLLDTIYEVEIINLFIPYLPYARQDKPIKLDNTFSLHTFANLLNFLNFDTVTCLDVHSIVAKNLIRNFNSIEPIDHINKVINITNPDVIVFPDKGAEVRYKNLVDRLPIVTGEKERNQQTGSILRYTVNTPTSIENKSALIIDDLCDGGMTFKLLTGLLKNDKLVKNVYLYTTHGIYSKGIRTLKNSGIDRIFSFEGEIITVNNKKYIRKVS